MRRYLLAFALASFTAAPLAAQFTINTGPAAQTVGPIGKDSQAEGFPSTFAQTFIAPTGFNSLQSFSFYLTNFINGGAVLLDASVYQFQDDHLSGAALYTTQLNGTDSQVDAGVLVQFGSAGSPLNVLLTQGTTYALVMSAANRYAATPDGSSVAGGATLLDAYDNGSLFLSSATDLTALGTGGAFFAADGEIDAAFSATFVSTASTVVPEPATVALFGAGLMLIGVVGVRRRQR
jgi:hypothetical protein